VIQGQASRTAMATAAARAAHLVVDGEPKIFEDTLAAPLLGDLAEELVASHRDRADRETRASMRVAMTVRSRYCDDRLNDAAARGTGQFVLLGAGLDSLAYRSSVLGSMRVFEVDHPATQAWKRERLAAAGIPVPDAVAFVQADFRRDSLRDRLVGAGLDPSRPAFVSWLGVTQYLTPDAIELTLDSLRGLASGTELVMEYVVPAGLRDEDGLALADFFVPRAAAMGEPWLTFLSPADVARLLAARGMAVVEDLGRKDQVDASLWQRTDGLRPHELGRVARAVVA